MREAADERRFEILNIKEYLSAIFGKEQVEAFDEAAPRVIEQTVHVIEKALRIANSVSNQLVNSAIEAGLPEKLKKAETVGNELITLAIKARLPEKLKAAAVVLDSYLNKKNSMRKPIRTYNTNRNHARAYRSRARSRFAFASVGGGGPGDSDGSSDPPWPGISWANYTHSLNSHFRHKYLTSRRAGRQWCLPLDWRRAA